MDARVQPWRTVTVLAYTVLGALLAWSRLYGLNKGGFCCDEIATVVVSVRQGPGTILAGAYSPNNHQLFSMFGWAASTVAGESEVVLRLGAALPFIAGAVIATIWLHARVGALSGVLFLFLATMSPLLIDLSRQARGYGIAFLAMSLLVVAALEFLCSHRRWTIAAFCAGGVAGALTLPYFTVAFLSIGTVLLTVGVLRRQLVVGLSLSIAAITAWYAPHVDAILDSSRQDYGVAISSTWLVTAPLDQTLVPAVSLLSDDYLRPNPASLALVVMFAIVMAASPLLRRPALAFVLVAPVIVTVLAFWMTNTRTTPRFFSFLLVPLFILAATGASSMLGGASLRRPTISTLPALVMLIVVAFASVPFLATIPRQPREAHREVATAIDELGSRTTQVFAYVYNPGDLEFHLGRRVHQTRTRGDVMEACAQKQPAIFVSQIWLLEPVVLPCADRDGVRHERFEQYARGDAIDLWVIPPRGETT